MQKNKIGTADEQHPATVGNTVETNTAAAAMVAGFATPIHFSLFTAEKPKRLTKKYTYVDGTLNKESGGFISKGRVQVRSVANLEEFAAMRDALTTDQCFGYGVSIGGDADITTIDTLNRLEEQGKTTTEIARAAKFFQWPDSPGIAAIDHDGLEDKSYLSQSDFIDLLYAAMPELKQAGILWAPSSSSFISNSETGEELQGLRGQRAYIAVDKASEVPRITNLLAARMWQLGRGWHSCKINGSREAKTPLDLNMCQPERLDFAAGAVVVAPLTQQRDAKAFYGSGLLNTAGVADLTPEEAAAVEAAKAISYASKQEESQRLHAAWTENNADKIVEKTGVSKPEARRIVQRASERGELSGEFLLTLADGEQITVSEVLRDPTKWHNTYLCDPIEPDEGEGDKSWLGLLKGPPVLHSHKHGGKTYKLMAQRYSVEFRQTRFAACVREVCEILRDSGEWFTLGTGGHGLTCVRTLINGRLREHNKDGFEQRLDELIRFTSYADKAKAFVDGPVNARLASRVGEVLQDYLPGIKAVVNRPLLLPNGRILQKEGYDQKTGLLFSLDGDWPAVPEQPTDAQALAALQVLWAPFKEFRFKTAGDRGAHLAAMLSAIVRPGLATCPMFLYAAHAIGSGKSLLAESVGALNGGITPSLELDTAQRERQQQIRTMLKENRDFLLFDNVKSENRIGGQTMELTMTSEFIDGRLLGGNTSLGYLPNKAMFVATSNNPSVTTDMGRRTVWVWLEPPTSIGKEYSLNPLDYVRENRRDMVMAAITLMKWALNRPAKARLLDSFEAWSRLVAFAVEQIGELEAKAKTLPSPHFANPIADTAAYMEHGETTADLKALLQVWAMNAKDGLSANDLFRKYQSATDGSKDPLGLALVEYLPEAPRDAKKVSYALRGVLGRPVAGYTLLTERDSATNSSVWKVACG